MSIGASESVAVDVGIVQEICPQKMPLPLFRGLPNRPFRVRSHGPVRFAGLLVFVWDQVLEAILEHGRSDPVYEIGGWLLGQYASDGMQPFVVVEARIPAEGRDKSPVGFSFTVEDQIRMVELREKKYPDLLVIGWYHSHPLGLRLSDTDKVAHRSVFREQFQIAMVMSTGGRDIGCAVWENDGISPVGGFFVLEDCRDADGLENKGG